MLTDEALAELERVATLANDTGFGSDWVLREEGLGLWLVVGGRDVGAAYRHVFGNHIVAAQPKVVLELLAEIRRLREVRE